MIKLNSKKQIFIAVNSLAMGGIQKSLLAFLDEIKEYADVDLLVWNDYFELTVPKYVNILRIPRVKSVRSVLNNGGLRNKDFWMSIAGQFYIKGWHAMPKLKKEYDIAIDYSHVSNIKYFVIDNVTARRKYAFFHNGEYSFDQETKRLDAEYYPKYDRVFAVSKFAQSLLKKTFSGTFQVDVFPNFIPINKIIKLGSEKCTEMDNYQGLKILSVGRLSEEKNPHNILQVCDELRRLGVEFRYYIVGDGVLRQDLELSVKKMNLVENVVFTGLQNNPYKYMKNCDLFIQLSKYEADPITIKEVTIFNKPMVLSDIPAFAEIASQYRGIKLMELDASKIAKFVIHNDIGCNFECDYFTHLNDVAKNALCSILDFE